MHHLFFLLGIPSLFLFEFAFFPGLFTRIVYPHFAFLILLTALYGSWQPWMGGLLAYIVFSVFFLLPHSLSILLLYGVLLFFGWMLTQHILGARSLFSYILYTVTMALFVALVDALLLSLYGFSWFIFLFATSTLLFFRFILPTQTVRLHL